MNYGVTLIILCAVAVLVIFYEDIAENTIGKREQPTTEAIWQRLSKDEEEMRELMKNIRRNVSEEVKSTITANITITAQSNVTNATETPITSTPRGVLTTSPFNDESIFDSCPLRHKNPWEKVFITALGKTKDLTTACRLSGILTSFVNSTVSIDTKIKEADGAKCEARCLTYKSNYGNKAGEWQPIDKKFDCDIVEVQCRTGSEKDPFYKTLHTQIFEHERDRKKEFGSLYRQTDAPKVKHSTQHPDVYIVLMDAMSMTSSFRELPQTVIYLMEAFEAVPFKNVAKVADNSKPNSVAFMFGEIPIKVDRTPFGEPKVLQDTLNEHTTCNRALDNETYIQFEYEDAGYKTMWACDFYLVNFGYTSCVGLKNQLATHYMRPFQVRSSHEKDELIKASVFNGEQCRHPYTHLLDYQEKFVNSYKGTPKMSLMWSVALSHDTEKDIAQADSNFRGFFERNTEKFDESFVIFMGDHGPRYDSATNTEQGLYDKNNPMMFVSLPKHLRGTKVHENLKRNAEVLSTHHDLHATLVDIVRHQPLSNFTDTKYLKINGTYGSSWLREFEEGKPRNCKTLPLPSQYCICDYGHKEVKDKKVKTTVSELALKELNSFLKERKVDDMCETWTIEEIVQVVSIPTSLFKEKYRIQFKAKPKGLFLTSVAKKSDDSYVLVEKSWERLDKYGNTSHCLSDANADLRGSCYCKKQ